MSMKASQWLTHCKCLLSHIMTNSHKLQEKMRTKRWFRTATAANKYSLIYSRMQQKSTQASLSGAALSPPTGHRMLQTVGNHFSHVWSRCWSSLLRGMASWCLRWLKHMPWDQSFPNHFLTDAHSLHCWLRHSTRSSAKRDERMAAQQRKETSAWLLNTTMYGSWRLTSIWLCAHGRHLSPSQHAFLASRQCH